MLYIVIGLGWNERQLVCAVLLFYNWYCFYTSPLTRRFNGWRVAGGMPTVCETNWHTSRSCRLSTGDGFNQVFTTIGFRNDVGNSDRICVKIVKQGFTVFAQQKSPVTLASSQVYWRKFYFYFSIIVTGRKCCCADT
jgi:hypothetical protein